MVSVDDIKKKYNQALLESQKLYEDRKTQDTAGAIRYKKGKIVEDITKDIIKLAWSKISSDESRISTNKKKIIIKTNGEVYKVSQDIHIFIDNVFKISVECKSYTEVAMYKRVLIDAQLLKTAIPTITDFFIVQLENFLGGDYGKNIEAKGSESVITLDRLFPNINLKIITLLSGDRNINKPIHKPDFFKPLEDERLNFAIKQFERTLDIR